MKVYHVLEDFSRVSGGIRTVINDLNITEKVEIVDFVKSEQNFKLFSQVQAFIAPSFSEVIGMVNLEVAVVETPVLTTYNTGLLKGWNNEGRILIKPVSRPEIS